MQKFILPASRESSKGIPSFFAEFIISHLLRAW
jgi:hypothetical protein